MSFQSSEERARHGPLRIFLRHMEHVLFQPEQWAAGHRRAQAGIAGPVIAKSCVSPEASAYASTGRHSQTTLRSP